MTINSKLTDSKDKIRVHALVVITYSINFDNFTFTLLTKTIIRKFN